MHGSWLPQAGGRDVRAPVDDSTGARTSCPLRGLHARVLGRCTVPGYRRLADETSALREKRALVKVQSAGCATSPALTGLS
jgi:hypothetical protein